MGFLKNLFNNESSSSANEDKNEKFKVLESINTLNEIDSLSNEKPILIFKHSTRCIISRTALKEFEREFDFDVEDVEWYLLDLLIYRDLSNEIALRYDVIHQSPQIILIKNGKAVFNASHEMINASSLKNYL